MSLRMLDVPTSSVATQTRRSGTLVALRLPSDEINLLRMVFGGIESKMGLGSCQGAQEFALNQRSIVPCRHGRESGRPRARRRKPVLSTTRETLAVIMGAPVSVDLHPTDAPNPPEVDAQGLEPVIDVSVESCPVCRSPRMCSECKACRRCGAKGPYLHVPSAQTSVFNVNEVQALEAWAWNYRKEDRVKLRQCRDALVELVETGRKAHVVVLARMYSAVASKELTIAYPGLEDLIPLATMTRAVDSHAEKMTGALRREPRAASFVATEGDALHDLCAAPNRESEQHKATRRAATDRVKAEAMRMLADASGAYLAVVGRMRKRGERNGYA